MSISLSILSGIFISLMILMNATLANHLGPYLSTVVIHGVGLVAITLYIAFHSVVLNQKMKLGTKKIPLWLYTGGIIGILTVYFNNYSFLKLGASLTLALGLLGQSLAALVVDHYALLGAKKHTFQFKKLIGLMIIATGIMIMAFSA